jgi:LacI family gluconate utilization system Gnt-I transcriptional repressor
MRQATLEEVAAAAGVSKMTASRALRGTADVSPQTRAKVIQAAEQLNYVANRLALSMSAQRTNLVAVVVPSMSNIVFPEVLAGISAGLEGSGMQAVFGISEYDAAKERNIIRDMLSWKPSALIVTGLDQPQDTLRILGNADVPVIQIMDLDGEPVDSCVGLSHGQAGEDMALALIAAGRRRFGYVGSALFRDVRAEKRRAGFERVLVQSGLEFLVQRIDVGASSTLLGKNLTAELLRAALGLDCIYYSNDDMAAGGLFACMASGINVPADILIAGFNGLELAQALPVTIATSESPRRQMGEAAAKLVLELSASRTKQRKVIAFKPRITGVAAV